MLPGGAVVSGSALHRGDDFMKNNKNRRQTGERDLQGGRKGKYETYYY